MNTGTQVIINASAHEIPLPDGMFHTVVTSPPYYSLRRYEGAQEIDWPGVVYKQMPGRLPMAIPPMRCALGLEPTPEAYIGHLVLCFREVYRVMREDAVCWIIMGDSYNSSGGTHRGGKHCEDRHGQPEQLGNAPALHQGDLMLIPHRLALALQADSWIVRNDVVWAKCLSGGAMVYAKTQKGEMPMTVKDMVRLDPATVQLWDGEKWNQCIEFEEQSPHPERKELSAQRRTHKYQTGEELPVMGDIEIELRNGERIGCTRDHKWPIEGLGMLIRAEDLKPGYVLKSTTLPEPEQPRMPAGLDDEEIGWFVGMYIAEGHVHNGKIGISSHTKETEREHRLIALAEKFDGYSWTQQTSENGMVVFVESPVLLGILSAYVSGQKAIGKHLHVRCWKRSNQFLDAILRGYLEGDGHWDGKRWRVGFCQNDALAADLRTICSRLGYSLRQRRAQHTMGDRKFPGWRGSLAFDGSYRKQSDYQIIAIRQSRARKFWNIALAEDPHLYALTCGVLTCNSSPMPESVSGWTWQRCRVKAAPAAREFKGHERLQGARADNQKDFASQAEWHPCPGCSKCSATGGYVLRRGSWRHTRAHETVIMAVKNMNYYADQERVREAWTDNNQHDIDRALHGSPEYNYKETDSEKRAGWFKMPKVRPVGNPLSGRNPRSVLTPSPESYGRNHYAVFPRTLISPLLQATAPTRVCPLCSAPWAPVVEREKHPERDMESQRQYYATRTGRNDGHIPGPNGMIDSVNVSAHRPTCECEVIREVLEIHGRENALDPVPGWALDPFVGSGTMLEVCRELGVNAVGLDISAVYLDDHAKPRIGQTPSGALETLPLFAGLEDNNSV